MGENRQPGSRLEKEEKRIVTENRRLEAVISFERGLSLERLTYRGTGENPVRMSRGRDLFSLEIRGRRLSPEIFVSFRWREQRTKTRSWLRFSWKMRKKS